MCQCKLIHSAISFPPSAQRITPIQLPLSSSKPMCSVLLPTHSFLLSCSKYKVHRSFRPCYRMPLVNRSRPFRAARRSPVTNARDITREHREHRSQARSNPRLRRRCKLRSPVCSIQFKAQLSRGGAQGGLVRTGRVELPFPCGSQILSLRAGRGTRDVLNHIGRNKTIWNDSGPVRHNKSEPFHDVRLE
jgi:hypothetical protein